MRKKFLSSGSYHPVDRWDYMVRTVTSRRIHLSVLFGIISIDPGRESLISAVRHHPDMENQSFPFPVLTKRKKALVKKCQQLKISTFDLKNTTWRSMNGSLRQSMRIQSLLDRRHMREPIQLLALTRKFSVDTILYMQHIQARVATSGKFIEIMGVRNKRRWKMEQYSQEQRAVEKLSTQPRGNLWEMFLVQYFLHGGMVSLVPVERDMLLHQMPNCDT